MSSIRLEDKTKVKLKDFGSIGEIRESFIFDNKWKYSIDIGNGHFFKCFRHDFEVLEDNYSEEDEYLDLNKGDIYIRLRNSGDDFVMLDHIIYSVENKTDKIMCLVHSMRYPAFKALVDSKELRKPICAPKPSDYCKPGQEITFDGGKYVVVRNPSNGFLDYYRISDLESNIRYE